MLVDINNIIMKNVKLEPEEFIPIQAAGLSRDKLNALSRPSERNIPPVEAVAYLGKYLLIDGNHRVYLAMLQKRKVETIVLETDEDVRNSVAISIGRCNNLASVFQKYEEIWKPLCEERGIKSVKDYRIKAPLSGI